MIKKCVALIVLIIVVNVFFVGCAGRISRLERDYGSSFKQAKSNQILNTEAEKNLAPVYGLDGPAAQVTMEEYRKSFKAPAEKPPTYLIGTILK
ncbi:MAG: hypothetical protein ACE5KZ_08010 [Candidatus Scalinduaceae bacterium]